MKKISILILCTAMFFALASCTSAGASGTVSSPQDSFSPATAQNAAVKEISPKVKNDSSVSVAPAVPAEEATLQAVTEAPSVAPQVDADVVAKAQAMLALQAEETATEASATNISEADSTAKPANDSIVATANGYTIEVLSARKTKDGQGNDCIFIRYKFTNTNSASAAFWQVTDQTVSQNGKVLSPEGIVCSEAEMMNSYSQISGGQTVLCGYPYPCPESSGPLDVKVSIYNYNSATTYASASGCIYVEE